MKLIHNNKEYGDIIFKVLAGSHAHGTATEKSDEDYKFIYIQSPEAVLEDGYQEQVDLSKDEVGYELRRFVDLLCTNNPTVMEILWSPEDCIIYKHPIMDKLLENRDKLLSRSCKYSFGGYAFSQLEKAKGLNKKMNWEKQYTIRKTILDFCHISDKRGASQPIMQLLDKLTLKQEQIGLVSIDNMKDCYAVYFTEIGVYRGIADENSNNVKVSQIPKDQEQYYLGVMHCNLDAYSMHCKKYKEYTNWLAARNTQRYVDIEGHGQQIDGKNMGHVVRLLEMSKEIATGQGFNVRRPNRDYLLSIRHGKVDLQTLLDGANKIMEETDALYEMSDLPKNADRGFFMSLLPKIRKQFYNENK